jgi:F-box and leucine-rich repeat protein GRR1
VANEGDLDDDEDFMHDGPFRYRDAVPRTDHPHSIIGTAPHGVEVPMQRNLTLRPSQVTDPFGGSTMAHQAPLHPIALNITMQPIAAPSNSTQTRSRGFGHQPVVEVSTSPTPSDVTSNRSTGTTQSNGAGFFRTYQDFASSSRSNGAMTPDYVYAEIGHGRGATPGHTVHMNLVPSTFSRQSFTSAPSLHGGIAPTPQGITQVMHSAGAPVDIYHPYERGTMVQETLAIPEPSVSWPHREPPSPVPTFLDPTDAPDFPHPPLPPSSDPREPQARGRNVKRSLRNTFNTAEHCATSFLFGRASASNSNVHDGDNSNGQASQSSTS